MANRRQGTIWMLTIPESDWTPALPEGISYIRGQKETGETTGYVHWQALVYFSTKKSLIQCKAYFPTAHCELSRSSAADEYVWKEDTRVEGSQFEFGVKPFRRNSATDWDAIWLAATTGDLLCIPSNVRVCHYRTLRAISTDYLQPVGMVRTINVFWGATGTGKSRRAWDEQPTSFPKDPRTKFWCGYRGEQSVIIDEFRGGIDIAHLLRWCDRYPVVVEIKGGATTLRAEVIYITSNLPVSSWYPDLDPDTYDALVRRLNIVHFE